MLINRFFKPLLRLAHVWVMLACSVVSQLHVAVASVDSRSTNSEVATNILFLESLDSEFDTGGFGVLSAVEMAVEDVNRNPEILAGCTLNLHNGTEDEVT